MLVYFGDVNSLYIATKYVLIYYMHMVTTNILKNYNHKNTRLL